MYPIRAGQIKAARALLDWSRDDLAHATGLSVATIRNLEMGFISPRGSTTNVVREAIENAGLEFIDPEGVRRRLDEVKVYRGEDSLENLIENIRQTVSKKGGEVVAIIKSQDILACLAQLNDLKDIKLVISETLQSFPISPSFQFRMISKHYIDPVPFLVYGDKHALILNEGVGAFKIVVFQSMSIAQTYKNHFYSIWDKAASVAGHKSST
ncbi:MAG: helix-turn-helix domain-containing protein [Alphaproteobacteria bacterium]|nr:helix-turn-helix domain-containing protein [Alphaproteobacteria bacterium]